MGTLSGGDGGGWPPDELPELPPEWGAIVIPDDASELAQEATRVRRELRRQARRQRWRRRLHLPLPKPPPKSRDDDEEATTLGVPLLVISIAVIATLTSLFAIAWPTRQQRPDLRPTAVASPPGGTSAPAGGADVPTNPSNPSKPDVSAPTGADTPRGIPDVPLVDPSGATLRLRETLPAVVLLVDGCDCSQLVAATAIAAAAVNPAISTVAVGTVQVPSVGDTPATVAVHLRAVVDPGAVLRARVPSVGRPSALLIRGNAELVLVVTAVSTVDDFRADLPKLT